MRLEAPDHLLDDLARLDRVRAGPHPRVRDAHLVSVVRPALHAPQADAVAAGAVVGPGGHGQRAREGQQAAVVVVPVGEGDQGLHPAAVVPGQATARHAAAQAAVQDRAALPAVRTLQVLAGPGGARHGSGRHLLGVPDDDHRLPPAHGPHGPGHRDLGGLVEHDDVHVAAVGREEARGRVRGDQEARGDGHHEVPVGVDQAPHVQRPPAAVELAAQLLGARAGLAQNPVAAGDDAAQQLRRQGLAQPPQGGAVVREQPGVDGRVEGLQTRLAGPGLEGGAGPLDLALLALGVAHLDELLARPVVGEAVPRVVQPLAVAVQPRPDGGQLPAQRIRVGGGRVGRGGPQIERAPQIPVDLGRLHAVVVEVEQQVPDARLLAQAAGDDVER